jgi:ketosteroid isomerase-like protein
MGKKTEFMQLVTTIGMPVVILVIALVAFKLGELTGKEGHMAIEQKVLLELDRDFDKATVEKGVDGWVSYFAEDGAMFPAGGEIVTGKTSIRELMAPVFATPGTSLRWEPLGAQVSRAGDLGYTYGKYVSKAIDPEGKPVTRYGKYVTIWKKQTDGSWKVVMDVGNASPPPPAPSQ